MSGPTIVIDEVTTGRGEVTTVTARSSLRWETSSHTVSMARPISANRMGSAPSPRSSIATSPGVTVAVTVDAPDGKG